MSLTSGPACAADSVVAQIMKIPGAGNGSPTDLDWQKVGELCLNPTKTSVQPGEFKGVELIFMGTIFQNMHNFMFRAFLKPWEAYTGAKLKWIDLSGDFLPRLQQVSASGTADFDIVEMQGVFEGGMGVKDLLSEMPDWVKRQVDFDDYVDYLKPPVGAWNGKIHRVSIDSDCHTLNYRTDVYSDPDLARQWKDWQDKAGLEEWRAPKTWQQVQAVTKFLNGKKVKGKEVYGFLDQPKPWGGFQFYFTGSRATAYAKYPGEKNWLFDENMKPLVNNPAWVRAIQDVVDALPNEPADQINADLGTTAFLQFLDGTGSLLVWWGDIGSQAKTSDTSVIGNAARLRPPAGVGRRLQPPHGAMGEAADRTECRAQHGRYRFWNLCDEIGRQRSEAPQGGLERCSASRRQRPVHVDGCLSLGIPALSQGPRQHRQLGSGRVRPRVRHLVHQIPIRTPTIIRTPRSSRVSPAFSSTTVSPSRSYTKRSLANRLPSRAPTTSPRPGRSSPTRWAARTRSSIIGPRWVSLVNAGSIPSVCAA